MVINLSSLLLQGATNLRTKHRLLSKHLQRKVQLKLLIILRRGRSPKIPQTRKMKRITRVMMRMMTTAIIAMDW